jgi:dolichyl-diphosphooligosaccharide--protein glycosyltransferase
LKRKVNLNRFVLLQVFFFLDWVKYMLDDVKLFKSFLRITLTCVISAGTLALGIGTASGYISPWTGRFYSLLDPTYAKDHIPIIASVSEHQPTAWSSFMFDFHILLFLFPAGLYFCFKRLSDATIFIVMYGLTSMYFAGVMVRLILVAAPAVCLISAIAVSATIKNLTTLIRTKSKSPQTTGKVTGSKAAAKVLDCHVYLLLYNLLFFVCSCKISNIDQGSEENVFQSDNQVVQSMFFLVYFTSFTEEI